MKQFDVWTSLKSIQHTPYHERLPISIAFFSFRFWLACEQLKATQVKHVPEKAKEIFK
jgi:hypothetical protein